MTGRLGKLAASGLIISLLFISPGVVGEPLSSNQDEWTVVEDVARISPKTFSPGQISFQQNHMSVQTTFPYEVPAKVSAAGSTVRLWAKFSAPVAEHYQLYILVSDTAGTVRAVLQNDADLQPGIVAFHPTASGLPAGDYSSTAIVISTSSGVGISDPYRFRLE